MQRLTKSLIILGTIICSTAAAALAQTGGVQVPAPVQSPADVRQDPNSALDFGAVRGAGAASVGENFRGNLGAVAPGQTRDLGQGLPASSIPSPSMSLRRAPDLSPNLRELAPEVRGKPSKSIEQSLILPRFRVSAVEQPRQGGDKWRFRYYQGRWWYWMPSNEWSYWDGARWRNYAAAVER